MYENVTGLVFETDCEIGRPSGIVEPYNLASFCTEPGSPNPVAAPAASIKAGLVSAGDFSGTPQKAAVIFASPFQDVNYSISLVGQDARSWTYESKAAEGFIINSNANGALTGEVSWIATPTGET